MISRRAFIASSALAGATLALPALADSIDPRMAQRFAGPADCPNVIYEWFSFTCPHCARFAAEVFPQVKAKLIAPGHLKYVFCEFPRDRLDLAAAMVARSLPPERYEAFTEALLASQMTWAFKPEGDPMDALAKEAALAGMPRSAFDAATNDDALRQALLTAQSQAQEKYNIDSTPTFIVNGKPHPGEITLTDIAGYYGLKV